MNLKDRIIIELARNGNSRAQHQLYQSYSKAMFNTCLRIVGTIENAEDVLQEAFTDAFTHLHTFDFRVSFGAWLKRIVINRSINFLRSKKIELLELDAKYDRLPDDDDDSGYVSLTVEKVMKAMELLPQKSKIVFSLYLLEGYDHEEISEILEISESTSKTQLMRAKLKVKELVNQY